MVVKRVTAEFDWPCRFSDTVRLRASYVGGDEMPQFLAEAFGRADKPACRAEVTGRAGK